MALNKAFSGYVYHTDDSLGNEDIYYRCYFYKVNGASSSSQWDRYEAIEGQVRKCESTGYWAFNLGDGGFLTQNGVAAASDIVIVSFFIDNDDKDSDALTAVGTYEWVMSSNDNYSKDMQLVSVDETSNSQCKPDLSQWRLNSQAPTGSSNGVVNTNYGYSSVNCDYVRQHTYSTSKGGTMYHWWTRRGATVHNGFRITTREYDFDDGLGWQTLTASGNYQWALADDYQCLLRLTTGFDNSDLSIRYTDDIELVIYWRSPVPDIDCLQDVANHIQVPDTLVTFQYNGTDLDTRITGIDWIIYDSTNSYHYDQLPATIVNHPDGPGTSWFGHAATPGAFGTSGTHNVAIVVHWDNGIDGTSTPDILYDEDFIQDLFSGPSVSFDQNPDPTEVGSLTDFSNTSTNVSRVGTGGAGEEYDWRMDDDGSITDQLDNPYAYVFQVTPTTILATIRLRAHWNDGFFDQYTDAQENIIFTAKVTVTQEDCYYIFHISGTSDGGGSPTGYRWRVYRDPDGVNELIWTSPTDLDQQDRRYYFVYADKYRIEGTIYGAGSPTTDTEDLIISDVCPEPGDETSLTIITTDPLPLEEDVAISTGIRAIFNDTISAPSITGRFTVSNNLGPISGSVSVDGSIVTFTPGAYLDYEIRYYGKIEAGVMNVAGSASLANDYEWNFMTQAIGGGGGGVGLIREESTVEIKPIVTVTKVSEETPAGLEDIIITNVEIEDLD